MKFVINYMIVAAIVMGIWLTVYWMEFTFKRLNLFVALVCSLLWPLALVYLTQRAAQGLSLRLRRDARLALSVKPHHQVAEEPAPRAPRETGLYD